MNQSFLKITATLLIMVGGLTACSTSKDIVIDETETDESSIDFSNIENLYAQPIPVIQKCLEGNWILLYSQGGFVGETIIDKNGSYMQISKERIIMGTKTYTHGITGGINEVLIDSPIIWGTLEKFWGNRDAHIMAYNFPEDNKNFLYGEHLFPTSIKNDTLAVWDLYADGYTKYYLRNNYRN